MRISGAWKICSCLEACWCVLQREQNHASSLDKISFDENRSKHSLSCSGGALGSAEFRGLSFTLGWSTMWLSSMLDLTWRATDSLSHRMHSAKPPSKPQALSSSGKQQPPQLLLSEQKPQRVQVCS